MATKKNICNLEFPSWCPGFSVSNYHFTRITNYEENIKSLQHSAPGTAEFKKSPSIGNHAITAIVKCPENESNAVIDLTTKNNTELNDILLLLSIFTKRDVFTIDTQIENLDPINDYTAYVSDSRHYRWGGILRCSIPYEDYRPNPDLHGYDIGFSKGINKIYELIRSDHWQEKYKGGFFLLLAKTAFSLQQLESSFIQCWTIWEHLFAILNQDWISREQIRKLSSVEKISFIFFKYDLAGKIDKHSRIQIRRLAETRNRLVHFGKFPERDQVHKDAELFIQLTESVIAKILGLTPSNVLNTEERTDEFFKNTD